MRQFPVVYMRGGTSKGLLFLEKDLPAREEWDSIFVQCMGSPDPKQIDGLGGCVSSNNKIVVVRKSERPGVDVDYLVGQSVVGKSMIDYKSNCGNMTAATAPYAIEMGLVEHLTEPTTMVHMFNLNTNKYMDVEVPVQDGKFNNNGDCMIAGVEGTAGELKVNFLHPAGSKTGKLFPTGRAKEWLDIPGQRIEATILDVSNPIVLVRAEDVLATGTELPVMVDGNPDLCAKLEAIRAEACMRMGFATSSEDATENSPAVPKVAFVSRAQSYVDITCKRVEAKEMDLCVRVISVFKCHKAAPLTAACAIAVAGFIPGTIVHEVCGGVSPEQKTIRIGHPSGVMTLYPFLGDDAQSLQEIQVSGVAVQRTARRIMDGIIYIRN